MYSTNQGDKSKVFNAIQNLIDILGEEFIDSNNTTIYADRFFHIEKFVGIYFGASWAAPCQEFDPMLIDFYNKVNKLSKKIEIIYVNSDEDAGQFNNSISQTPWLAIPFNDSRVMELK